MTLRYTLSTQTRQYLKDIKDYIAKLIVVLYSKPIPPKGF
jgi:hypothetical protein